MMYCHKHAMFFSPEPKCPKCVSGEPTHLRTREEVANPKEWARFKRMGWVKE